MLSVSIHRVQLTLCQRQSMNVVSTLDQGWFYNLNVVLMSGNNVHLICILFNVEPMSGVFWGNVFQRWINVIPLSNIRLQYIISLCSFKLETCVHTLTRNGCKKNSGRPLTLSVTGSWLARKIHMMKPSNGTFHSHNFRVISAFVLHGVFPT